MKPVVYIGLRVLNFSSRNFYLFKNARKISMAVESSSIQFLSSMSNHDCIGKIKEFIPRLRPGLHKGECGKIGVIGGSFEYTGAPFYAAIAALKTGADLVYIFCCEKAGIVIKSYSPELIVLPILDREDVVSKIVPWLEKLHVLVIGPGLGRDPYIMENVRCIIKHCKDNIKPSLPLVIDADGLFLVSESLSVIKNYKGPLLFTPNLFEFDRFANRLSTKDSLQVAAELNGVVVEKGKHDIITNGINQKKLNLNSDEVTLICQAEGSNRRCGGQGDLLAGTLATFVAWFQIHKSLKQNLTFMEDEGDKNVLLNNFHEIYTGYSLAAYAACSVIKITSKVTYEKCGRGTTTTDMIPMIPKAFNHIFNQ